MRNKLYEYWLSYDSDNQISCATIILSKDKLTQEEVMHEMKSVSVNFENLLLRLSRGRRCKYPINKAISDFGNGTLSKSDTTLLF